MMPRSDLVGLLADLGLNYITDKGDEIWARCPMHMRRVGKEDSNPSWSLNRSTLDHHCFSCGYGGKLLYLVLELRDCNQFEAKRYIRSFGADFSLGEIVGEAEAVPERPRRLPEFAIKDFGPPPKKALEERWFTSEACEHYGVRWRQERDAWIIPIKMPSGALIGWQEKGPDYVKNRPYGVRKSETLFGLDQFNGGRVILLESPLDVVYLWSLGEEGALATFGSSVSDAQKRLIVEYADELVVAFDNPRIDHAGAKAALDMKKTLSLTIPALSFFEYGDGECKDPGELAGEDVVWGIERAVPSRKWMPPKGVLRVHRKALRVSGARRREDGPTGASARRIRNGPRQGLEG